MGRTRGPKSFQYTGADRLERDFISESLATPGTIFGRTRGRKPFQYMGVDRLERNFISESLTAPGTVSGRIRGQKSFQYMGLAGWSGTIIGGLFHVRQ